VNQIIVEENSTQYLMKAVEVIQNFFPWKINSSFVVEQEDGPPRAAPGAPGARPGQQAKP
jgi:hypothetical protein